MALGGGGRDCRDRGRWHGQEEFPACPLLVSLSLSPLSSAREHVPTGKVGEEDGLMWKWGGDHVEHARRPSHCESGTFPPLHHFRTQESSQWQWKPLRNSRKQNRINKNRIIEEGSVGVEDATTEKKCRKKTNGRGMCRKATFVY
jgi:hypothetical protein